MHFALASFLLLSCQDPNVGEVKDSLRGPEYVRTATASYHQIAVRYIPPTLNLLSRSNLDGSSILEKKILDSVSENAGLIQGMIFHLRIDPKPGLKGSGFENDLIYGNKSGYEGYQESLNAFLFGMKEKIWLEIDGKKIEMTGYQMENSFGVSKGRTFVLAFPNSTSGEIKKPTVTSLVLDDIVPGLSRKKMVWTLPVGKYDEY